MYILCAIHVHVLCTLQQSYVLAELKKYLDSNPADAAATLLTVQFLEALNEMFEEGFLSHKQIDSLSSPVLLKMSSGYQFFTAWLNSLLAEGEFLLLCAIYMYMYHLMPFLYRASPNTSIPKIFFGLASMYRYMCTHVHVVHSYIIYSACILFMIMISYADLGSYACYLVWIPELLHRVLELHPGFFVSPLRANGSAIETIFSQLKHGSRGTLTAVSYGPARAQLLTRRTVHGPHTRDEYRDAPVYIKDSEFPSRKRPRKK